MTLKIDKDVPLTEESVHSKTARQMEIGHSVFFIEGNDADKLVRELIKQHGAGSFTKRAAEIVGDEHNGFEQGEIIAGYRVWRVQREVKPRAKKA